jgi:exonuclease SbcC
LNKYIKTLYIENFQSHANTTIKFDPGLNILVGESDQGKTAVIRALRWVMFNEPRGTGFIRVGETRCEVTITLSDGTRVSRIRDESQRINRYVVKVSGQEEQIFEKFKNDIPLEVQRELSVYPLWIDRDRALELNIARQLDSPFLLTESASTRSKVIGRIANLHILDAAQRDILRDIKNLNKTKSGLEDDIVSLEEKVNEYDDLPEKEQQLKELKVKLEQIVFLQGKISQLSTIKTKIDRASASLDNNCTIIKRLAQIEYVNQVVQDSLEISVILKSADKINDRLNSAGSQLETCCQKINLLKNISICIEHQNKLESNINLLARIEKIQKNIKIDTEKLAFLQKVIEGTDSIEKGDPIIQQLYEIRQEGIRLQELRRRVKALFDQIQLRSVQMKSIKTKLSCLDNLELLEEKTCTCKDLNERFNHITDFDNRYKSANAQLKSSNTHLKKVEDNYAKMVNSYTELLTEAGICPTCHSQITPEVVRKISDSIKLLGM